MNTNVFFVADVIAHVYLNPNFDANDFTLHSDLIHYPNKGVWQGYGVAFVTDDFGNMISITVH